MIKKYLRKLKFYFFPELKVLKKNYYNIDYLVSFEENVIKGVNTNFAKTYRMTNVEVGNGTYIEHNSIISYTKIGNFSSIGPNFFCGWGIHPTNGLSTSPMFYSTNMQNGSALVIKNKIEERKTINIGSDVFIGANVTVLDGVTIGDGAVIGAGAVVSKDIPPYAIAVGSPIKVIRFRFKDEQISALLRIKWWNFSEEDIVDVEKMFFDIQSFIDKYDK